MRGIWDSFIGVCLLTCAQWIMYVFFDCAHLHSIRPGSCRAGTLGVPAISHCDYVREIELVVPEKEN